MNIKKMQKAVFTARGHVDATWHSGPRGSATRAHGAYLYIYLFNTYYNRGLQPCLYGKVIDSS